MTNEDYDTGYAEWLQEQMRPFHEHTCDATCAINPNCTRRSEDNTEEANDLDELRELICNFE